MMKTSLFISIAALLNVVISFVSQLIIYSLMGVGSETDALVASATIPHLLAAIFTIALTSALVPIFSGENHDKQNKDTWSVLSFMMTGFGLLAIILILLAPYWVSIALPGFKDETLTLTIKLVKIQLICMVFIVGASIVTALMYAREKFLYVELINLLFNITVVLLIYFTLPIFGVESAAWANTLRPIAVFLILVFAAGKPQCLFKIRDNTKEVFKRIKPVIMGNTYTKTDGIIEKYLLSTASPGAISLLSLAQQIYSAGGNVISKTFGVTAIPQLSIHAKQNNSNLYYKLYNHRILIILSLTTLPFLILLAKGDYFLELMLGYGRVTGEDIFTLEKYLIYLGPGFIASTIGVVTTGAFYALGNTVIPNRILVITYTIFILLKITSYFHFGIIGLCITSSAFHITRVITEKIIIKKYF